ncbi:unnamed protein product, partial [Owenia fusiformis]
AQIILYNRQSLKISRLNTTVYHVYIFLPECHTTIPDDGNLYNFTIDQMADFFKQQNIEDSVIQQMKAAHLDGKAFSKLSDNQLKRYGLDKQGTHMQLFRNLSRKKTHFFSKFLTFSKK